MRRAKDSEALRYAGLGHEFVGIYTHAGHRVIRSEGTNKEHVIRSFDPTDIDPKVFRKTARGWERVA